MAEIRSWAVGALAAVTLAVGTGAGVVLASTPTSAGPVSAPAPVAAPAPITPRLPLAAPPIVVPDTPAQPTTVPTSVPTTAPTEPTTERPAAPRTPRRTPVTPRRVVPAVPVVPDANSVARSARVSLSEVCSSTNGGPLVCRREVSRR